mgnify:CR=1 FL=1
MDLISIAAITLIVYLVLSMLFRTAVVMGYLYFMYKMFNGDDKVSSATDWMSDTNSAFPFGND